MPRPRWDRRFRLSILRSVVSCACLLAAVAAIQAQLGRRESEWMTNGGDAQRSHWIPSDARISRESLGSAGFQFLWKVKLDDQAVQSQSLAPAVLIDRYIGYRGFRSLAFVGGGSNTVSAIDTDLSRLEWQHRFSLPAPPSGSPPCPGGMTANVARETTARYPPLEAVGGGLGGRSAPASSAIGEANGGAVTLAPALAAVARGPVRRTQRLRLPALLYAVAGDGMLHSLYLSNGIEAGPPFTFLPPNANAQGLIVLDGVAYATTGNCGGAPSGVWALDMASKEVNKWIASRGAMAGEAGPAFGPDGTVYAATDAGELVALSAKSLKPIGSYTTGGQPFTSSPVVFPYKGKTLLAAATKDGRIHLVDGASLGGADNRKLLFTTPAYASDGGFAPTALATWQALDGVRWLLAASNVAPASGVGFAAANGPVTNGTVAAWRVVDRNGAILLEPGWLSRDLISPLTPVIINGVVFAVSSGELRPGDGSLPAPERVSRSSAAVLYALDGATGKTIWDSGTTIASFVHSGGLSGQAGQVYLETFDETLYAFGFPMEH
jgi:outer membrane protein assembly factor BamB